MIITKNKENIWNNHSDIDGIGAPVLKLPKEIYRVITTVPAFSWVLENNNNVYLFAKLNPFLFFYTKDKIKDLPHFIKNRDGWYFDYKNKKFFKF